MTELMINDSRLEQQRICKSELFKIYLYSYMCAVSAAYTVLLCWHCCRKRYRDAFSTAVKILPITELHLGPAHTQVIELKFIITLARENS